MSSLNKLNQILRQGRSGVISLGLLGANISHSLSKEMYEGIIGESVDYSLIDIDKEENIPSLTVLFDSYKLQGMSITYPYKKHFIKAVSYDDPLIESLKAINCIYKREDVFWATNTDFLAALHLIETKYLVLYENFVILGSGNMAKVFEVALKKMKLDYISFNRQKDGDLNSIDYQDKLSKFNIEKTLIINTCSRDFIFKPTLALKCGFWDMNYSFSPHQNLDQKGLKYFEGIDLLKEQAKSALKFWEMSALIKNK